MPLLYHTPLSAFCRKVRMSLREKDIEFSLVNENPWDRNVEFLSLNPAGEVPVFVEDDGSVISGSYAICEYLEEVYTQNTLLGNDSAQRAEVRRLVNWFDHTFNRDVTQNIVHEKAFKQYYGGGGPDSARIRLGKQHLDYHLDYIGHLSSSRYFLAGESLTLADLAAASHLSALDYLGDVNWNYNKAAYSWYALIKSRPSMRHILIERVRGVRPPAHYENPDF